jgi:hypothetical protein
MKVGGEPGRDSEPVLRAAAPRGRRQEVIDLLLYSTGRYTR